MNVEETTDVERRVRAHAALADVTRLRIVDRLFVSDASASELGALLDVPSNLLAHHLKVLEQGGLVARTRSEGDKRRSYLTLVREAVPVAASPVVPARPRRLLFVCTANTARSHLAAALWRTASPIAAASAGTLPGERIQEGAIEAARRHGVDLPLVPPALLAEVQRPGDLVITVCDRAHEELQGADWAHWSVPDPVGRDQAAFDHALEVLSGRVSSLAPRLRPAA